MIPYIAPFKDSPLSLSPNLQSLDPKPSMTPLKDFGLWLIEGGPGVRASGHPVFGGVGHDLHTCRERSLADR